MTAGRLAARDPEKAPLVITGEIYSGLDGNPLRVEYSLESLKLRIESTEDLDEFDQKTREAHKLASEKFYFGQTNPTVKTREEFLELAANKLAKNGALTIAADIENDQDGAPIRLWTAG